MSQRNPWLPLVLSLILAGQPIMQAQQRTTPTPESTPLPTVQTLRVIPLAGNGEQNEMERGLMAPLVVQVLDQNGRPVEGADVVFRFPVNGPSAAFPDQKNSLATKTNADGQAAATGWRANGQVGTFQVRVTATRANEMGEASVTMTNVTRIVEDATKKRKRWWNSTWFKVALIAGIAGAVTAGVIIANDDSSGSTIPTITISPGIPTVGGPQ
jgi:hypothetical protein